ncbi:MAG: hypothetical protein H0X17_03165, partial [Deltaproteobacteria bacterium]|nr:hypothetical protein [Deltaproteobacteria bacterium]
MSDPFVHLDDEGRPCRQHAPATADRLLALATIGSGVSSFNHDIASKLQGLMMALDEIGELVEDRGDDELKQAAASAIASLAEVNQLLTANRALTRTGVCTRVALRDVVAAASRRFNVTVCGELPDGQLEGALALLAHGLGLALDIAAGPGRGRSLDVEATAAGARIELAFSTVTPAAEHAGDHLALAAFAIGQAGGTLCCTSDQR